MLYKIVECLEAIVLIEYGMIERTNPLQGDSKPFIYEFSVALFEFTNILECEQLITYSYF